MIIGAMLLKNFYSVFDYEKNRIGLGVDMHSKELVSMELAKDKKKGKKKDKKGDKKRKD